MLEIQALNLRSIDDSTALVLNRLMNRIRLERLPDDPPTPLDQDLQGWRNLPEFEEELAWLVWNEDHTDLDASGGLEIWNTEDNRHLCFFDIMVIPECRRQGLAKQLLARIAEAARQNDRRLMMAGSNGRVPAGTAFLRSIGAQPGMEARTNQLKLAELDRRLVEDWLASSVELQTRFSLGFWDGNYPEEQLEAVVEMFEIANDEPHDLLEIEDRKITGEMLRQMEQYRNARRVERWTTYVVENSTGKFCGFTEVFWNPNQPTIIQQGFTGVHPDYRGQKLGRWLKAAMVDKVLRDRSLVTLVRTRNANSNAAMMAINDKLGFKPYLAETLWQVETAKVLESQGVKMQG